MRNSRRNTPRIRAARALLLLAAFSAAFGSTVSLVNAGAILKETLNQQQNSAALQDILADLSSKPPLVATTQAAGKKRALVIGAQAYTGLTKLNTAIADAEGITASLTALGFEVTKLDDVKVDAFDAALEDYYASLNQGDIAFFYYAGHGVAFEGENYLLPVDTPALERLTRSSLDRAALSASKIVERIKERGVARAFVVLDACRNNPFPNDLERSAAAIGLARMRPTDGVFTIYSASLGQKALDRLGPTDPGPYSVFARKFAPNLTTPGLPIQEIATRTKTEVRVLASSIEHTQVPAYYDEFAEPFYFQPPQPRMLGIVVAIDDYADHALRGALNDGEKIARALEALGAASVERIFNADARLKFIEFAWRATLENARPGDTIVFSFAGSGYQETAPDAKEEGDGLNEILILSGGIAKPEAPLTERDREHTLDDDTLTRWVEAAAKKNVNVLMLVDGCHGGGLIDGEFPNVSFIGASAEAEQAMEKRIGDRIHGIGSFAFATGIEGAADLNKDGYISQRELFASVSEAVTRISNGRQSAQFIPSLEESGAGLALIKTPGDLSARVETARATPWPFGKTEPAIEKSEPTKVLSEEQSAPLSTDLGTPTR